MENKKLKFPTASILLAISLLLTLISDIIYASHGITFSATNIISIIAQLAVIVILFMKRHDIILFAGTALLSIPTLISVFTSFNLYRLIALLAYLMLLFIVGTATLPQLNKFKQIAEKVYFLPAVLCIISEIPYIRYIANEVSYGIDHIFLLNLCPLLSSLIFAVAMLLLAKWSLDPYEKEKPVNDTLANNTATGNAVLDYNDAYCELVKHILLSLFTCGIWTLIWIHKTTKVLNRTPDAEQYDPTKKLLLCMFVPFYMVYWFKKHGERIDKLNAIQNNKSDNATMYLLLGLFIPVVACILMQDNINKLCAPATTTPQFVSAAPVSTEKSNVELMKEYKELLDRGAITQEEFDAKKKQLLNL